LPYIEQQPLFQRYNLSYDYYDPVNAPVVQTIIPLFVCPSAPSGRVILSTGPVTAGSANPSKGAACSVNGLIDYLAPNGFAAPTTGWGASWPAVLSVSSGNQHQAMSDSTGSIFGSNATYRHLADIRDGLSNTLIINETAGWPQQFVGRTRVLPDWSLGNRGSWAGWQSFVYPIYSFDGTLNSLSNPTAGDLLDCAVNCNNHNQPYSFHPSGAYVLFCDGSTRFVNETISGMTMGRIVMMDDGLALTAGEL
jgi:prepilin-type processing-associated H-X9-DG protein